MEVPQPTPQNRLTAGAGVRTDFLRVGAAIGVSVALEGVAAASKSSNPSLRPSSSESGGPYRRKWLA